MWLVIFPEGTRYNLNNTAVIEKSQEFASEKGKMLLDLTDSPWDLPKQT